MTRAVSYSMLTRRVLRIVLMLAAVHSFATGVGLILQPALLLEWAGWGTIEQHFFPAQGGVFHILMAGLYVLAIRSDTACSVLIPFIILVKITAAAFLIIYYVAFEAVWMVLASAITDGLFAAVLSYLHMQNPARTRSI